MIIENGSWRTWNADHAKRHMGELDWLEKALFEYIALEHFPSLAISAANLIRNVTVNGALLVMTFSRLFPLQVKSEVAVIKSFWALFMLLYLMN